MIRKILKIFASLRLAILLLIVLMVSLAAGTIVESRSNAEIAGKLVYYSWWFIGLQVLLAVNVAMSLVVLFPWTKGRIGFAVTHASLVIIMLGAAITFLFKTEGTITIWEGDSESAIVKLDSQGCCELSRHELPFSVTLKKFVLDTYPGTERPSGYASYVLVTDKQSGERFPAKIWMNHELKYRGYSLFQSSYSYDRGRAATVLSVSRDPGQNIVFAGYITLVIGLVWMLVTRARAVKRTAALMLALLFCVPALSSQNQTLPDATLLEKLASLPVQHDGRAMPFDTFARDMVKTITGSTRWRGEEPTLTVAHWINNPDLAADTNNVMIGSADLAIFLGFSATTKHASIKNLFYNQGLAEQWRMYEQRQMHGIPISKTIAAALELVRRIELMREILYGRAIRSIPIPGEPQATWQSLEVTTSESLARLLDSPRLHGWPDENKIAREIFYNKLNPVRFSWVILLCSLLVSIAAWLRKHRWMDITAFILLSCGTAMMTWGIILRWQAGERIPAANMYESMLFLAWGIGLFAVVAYGLMRNRILILNAAIMATLAMLLTDMLPMDQFIRPIAPVLAGTPWLAIHVPIIMVGYAVLALGLVAAHMQVGAHFFWPKRQDYADRFYDMLYWCNFAGVIFLLTGILTGSVWAAFSWGRYWGWDPKEVWSLVAFLAYMAIIHAKVGRLIDKFGVAIFSILAFQTILMTYLGVNYILTIGLHSYGMGDSPMAVWLLLVALVEIVFIGCGVSAYLKLKTEN